ncbi:uncharacterized protein F5891DRAFT_986895 [Suillus fuscotomentosus]|uniref:Myb/SANT-like domain-containing protein n=1 Tax=Suillus fuscotomentosus TaxID=1912939 RepID=A0AAD4HCA8_9AGAM|nr:uncharacterized protein F5891DRAFT_986895 [Suillus fuscotomentosus]KAG1890645.1 hypothetical protein F5891DRAFT_986895 [Suillus fuscotomentosus]
MLERTRKIPAHWTIDEERAPIDYLSSNKSGAGDGLSFKMTTFQGAAEHIKKTFTHQRGGEKTTDSCKMKWGNLKSAYGVVVNKMSEILNLDFNPLQWVSMPKCRAHL